MAKQTRIEVYDIREIKETKIEGVELGFLGTRISVHTQSMRVQLSCMHMHTLSMCVDAKSMHTHTCYSISKQEKQRSKQEKAKKRKNKVQNLYGKNTKLLNLILTIFPSRIHSLSNKEVISNLKTTRSGLENSSIRKILA